MKNYDIAGFGEYFLVCIKRVIRLGKPSNTKEPKITEHHNNNV